MPVWIMLFKRFGRIGAGFVSALIVYFLYQMALSDPDNMIRVNSSESAVSGSLSATIAEIEDYGDGIAIRMAVTNNGDKIIHSAKGLLVARDEAKDRLMQDEQFIVKFKEAPFSPGQTRLVEFFIFNVYPDDVYYVSFVGEHIQFNEG